MIVVIDCNVIVSAGVSDGFVRRVLRRIIAEHEIIITADIVDEYAKVALYSKFSSQVSANIQSAIADVEGCAVLIEAVPCGIESPDPSDAPYIDAAIAGDADYLITGNLKHFPDGTYGNARVIGVRGFAELAGMVSL
ncbi:MAG: putative toxin-antitoxin system toxin component, PIN family [Rhodospirillales bacterium]|nr:putative toxin-antitoxin system toxin component, PIN family [Rhodospirillales bacterium]